MAFDPRQAVAAFLTLSMFVMLGNMIKQDHFDSSQVRIPETGVNRLVQEDATSAVPKAETGPWMAKGPELKACWNKPPSKANQSKGFITFSLTIGPEYHLSQITDAVVIARYLGAALVLPDIRGSELGLKRNFEDVYNVEKFMKSLDGVVKIVKEVPAEVAVRKPAVVRVPNRMSEDFIVKNIEPIFRSRSYLRIAIFFPTVNLSPMVKHNSDLDSTSCLAVYDSLELKPEVLGVADTTVERLKTLSRKADGKFIAVDLRVDVLESTSCKGSGSNGRKSCYSAQEVSDFLKKIGFDRDTTIYVTQTWWHDSLDVLKESFPKTYTKDDVIPADKKGKFLKSGGSELHRALDFHICSQSDVFVPAISGLFYENVVGKRIPSGKTQILIPFQSSLATAVSPYVSEKNHPAYSCYC